MKLRVLGRWMKSRMRVIVAMVACLGVGAAVTTVVAADATVGGGGVIAGCYNTLGTPMKSFFLIDKEAGRKCQIGYTEIDFNQTGPQGPQGVPGPQGPAGADGTSTVYFNGAVTSNFLTNGTWSPTGRITLPACPTGTCHYLVEAQGTVVNTDSLGAECAVGTTLGARDIITTMDHDTTTKVIGTDDDISGAGTVDVGSTAVTIYLSCERFGSSGTVFVSRAKLWATQVQNLVATSVN